jgi:hypothetical protein
VADDDRFAEIRAALVLLAGGYLRNPIREPGVTCLVCTTPVERFERCFQCNEHQRQTALGRLADRVAPLVYAVGGTQSGRVLRGYKGNPPDLMHISIVRVMLLLGVTGHAHCAGALAGAPVSHWAVVPSLPRKDGEHPLQAITAWLSQRRWPEVPLIAAENVDDSRSLNANHFTIAEPLPVGAHVLLFDDTWATGGHVQSAVLSLRDAGAGQVSVMIVARWLDPSWNNNADFIGDRLTRHYDPKLCPWTGGPCP